MSSCVDIGHAWDIVRTIKVSDDRAKEEYECIQCGYEYSDYVSIDETNVNKLVSLCVDCDEEIELDEKYCQDCKELMLQDE